MKDEASIPLEFALELIEVNQEALALAIYRECNVLSEARLLDEAVKRFAKLLGESFQETFTRSEAAMKALAEAIESVGRDESATAGAPPTPTKPDDNKPASAARGGVERGKEFDPDDDDHPQDPNGLVIGEELGSVPHCETAEDPKEPEDAAEGEIWVRPGETCEPVPYPKATDPEEPEDAAEADLGQARPEDETLRALRARLLEALGDGVTYNKISERVGVSAVALRGLTDPMKRPRKTTVEKIDVGLAMLGY